MLVMTSRIRCSVVVIQTYSKAFLGIYAEHIFTGPSLPWQEDDSCEEYTSSDYVILSEASQCPALSLWKHDGKRAKTRGHVCFR